MLMIAVIWTINNNLINSWSVCYFKTIVIDILILKPKVLCIDISLQSLLDQAVIYAYFILFRPYNLRILAVEHSSSNASALYSEDAWFESRPGNQVSSLRGFLRFSSVLQHILGITPEIRSRPLPSITLPFH
jgi:hypothetical protein